MFSTIVSQTEVFTTSRNSFQKTGSSYDDVPNQHFFRTNFKFYACFRPLSSQMEAFTISRNGFQRIGSSYYSYRINIFENFKSCSCLQLLSVKRKCLRLPEIVLIKPEVVKISSLESYTCFRLLSSQMEAFTTFRNGFRRTGSSYNVVSNQHFRKMSSPVRVFDYCQSNGSVYDLQKQFPDNRKQLRCRHQSTFSKNSNPMHVFDFCQVKWKRLRPPEMVSREPEVVITSYRINIFEKFQVLFMFSIIVSQTEEFTTSRNSFQKTGSSYDVVTNQHFQKFKSDACFRLFVKSNGSVCDLQKWFSENRKQLRRRPESTFSRTKFKSQGYRQHRSIVQLVLELELKSVKRGIRFCICYGIIFLHSSCIINIQMC